MPRKRWLPDNVTPFRDKCGRTRYRFRKKGLPQYLFRSEPGSEAFMEELAKAKAALPADAPRFQHGSFDALIASYKRSQRWADMKPITQQMRGNALARFAAKHGSKPVDRLEARHIDRWMGELKPHAANDLRKMLNQLMKHAILLGWRRDNPVEAVQPRKVSGDGYHCWTEEEIAAYAARWPIGTRERLALELLLWTGLRRGDMVNVGRQHRRGDKFVLYHGKNRSEVIIPILEPLAKALDAVQGEHLTYLVTNTGKAFSAAGFGNWFRDRCNEAGLPHCSAHGLRKALSRRLAESGVTTLQGRAVTGHKTDAMFAHYAAAASKETMASEAMQRLADKMGGKPPMANKRKGGAND